MVEFRESVSENTQNKALFESVNRIKECSQSYFDNSLEIQYNSVCGGGACIESPRIYYYDLVEVTTELKRGRLFTRESKKYQRLFGIYEGFYSGREIFCEVYDRSILGIVKKEIQKYAGVFYATAVNLKQDFAW